MNAMFRWSIVGLLALTVGCTKSEPTGGTAAVPAAGGAAAAKPVVAAPATEDSPAVVMTNLWKSVSAGDVGAMWMALPAKYQADLTGLKNEFAVKMDAELWNKAFVVINKTATLLKTKKEMIFACPMMAEVPAESKAAMTKDWDALVMVVSTLGNSEIKTLDGLKNLDLGRFLASTGTAVGGQSMKAAKTVHPVVSAGLTGVGETKFTLVSRSGDKAVLKKETPGEETKEVEVIKVDGKWLPGDMVEDWNMTIDQAKAGLATLEIKPEDKTQAMGLLAMAETTIDGLEAAKDQAAFDGQLVAVTMMMGPIMGALGGGGGSMSGPPGAMLGPPGSLPGGLPGGLPSTPGGAATPTLTPPAITPPTVNPPKVEPPKTP